MRFLHTLLLLALFNLNAFAQTGITHEKWTEDIDYLNNKIQKTFQSFIPGIKDEFQTEINVLKSNLPQLKDHEIKIELMGILSHLKDGHTELNVAQKEAGFHRLPFVLYFFNGELRVIKAHENYKEYLGSIVVRLGNGSTTEVFEKLKRIQSHDNEMEFLHSGTGYLTLTEILAYLGYSPSPTISEITLEKSDGQQQTILLEGLGYDEYLKGPWVGLLSENKVESPLYLRNQSKQYWYEYIPEKKTMYFHFSRVNDQRGELSLKKFTKSLFAEVDKNRPDLFVIDLRDNNGGNYHKSEPLIKAIKARPWLNQKGRVWAITGRTTFSAASVTTIFLRKETNTQLIGEPGRTDPNLSDNIEYMQLPNSRLTIEYTTKIKKHWPELTTNYIPVDVEINQTFDEYQQGIDPVLLYLFKTKPN